NEHMSASLVCSTDRHQETKGSSGPGVMNGPMATSALSPFKSQLRTLVAAARKRTPAGRRRPRWEVGHYKFSTGTFKSHPAAGHMNLCDHAHTPWLRLRRSVDGSNRRLPASQPHRSACQVESASTSLRSRKTKPPSRYRFPKTEQHAVSHHRRDFDLENLVPFRCPCKHMKLDYVRIVNVDGQFHY